MAMAEISANNWARARAVLEDLDEALANSDSATDDQRLRWARMFAIVEQGTGRPGAAISRLEQAATRLDPDSESARLLEGDVCDALIAAGRRDEARVRSEQWLVRAQRAKSLPLQVATLGRLARIALQDGDPESSRRSLEAALAIQQRPEWTDDPALAQTLHELGFLAVSRRDAEAAEEFLSQSLALYERSLGEVNPMTSTVRAELADVLRATGREDEAERLALEARNGWMQIGGEFTQGWSTALRVLAEANIARGDWEAAEPYARERYERSPAERRESTRGLWEEVRAHLDSKQN